MQDGFEVILNSSTLSKTESYRKDSTDEHFYSEKDTDSNYLNRMCKSIEKTP